MPGTPDSTPEQDGISRKGSGPGLFGFFRPEVYTGPQITDPDTVRGSYRKNQWNILMATMIGYALYYFVRKNLSVAMPLMEKELGVTKVMLGTFLTAHGVVYGLSKFANGFMGDRCNARKFMVAGLLACSVINAAFAYSANLTAGMSFTLWGSSAMVWVFGILWILNGWFQGMGFPPCARLMTHWFPPKVLAMRMSIWNTSHSIGAAAVVALGGWLAGHHYGWQAQFYVPAAMALMCCVYLWAVLKDTPESMGLPPVETLDGSAEARANKPDVTVEAADNDHANTKNHFMKMVFTNPYIWIIAFANFFVYTVRYAIFDWGPTLFSEAKHFDLKQAAYITTTYEFAGIFGMLLSGWITDNIFGGRGARTCLFYMAACTVAIVLLWQLPLTSGITAAAVMGLAGFCIYGPQALVGIAVANLATKHAAATAVGLTGLLGYFSVVLSGVGVGYIAHNYGWTFFFELLCGFGVVGTVLFALAWGAPAHGYKQRK